MQQANPQTPAASAENESQLVRLNQEFINAVKNSDGVWFESHLAADFLNSNGDGTLSARAEFVHSAAQPIQVADFTVHDVLVRLFGSSAIVHGRTSFVHADGRAGAGRYTDVWAKAAGRWLCVAADVSRG